MHITLRDLEIRYPGMDEPLLSIPSAHVESGGRVLLRGDSGSGKSSLLHVLTGLARPSAGDVQLGHPAQQLVEGVGDDGAIGFVDADLALAVRLAGGAGALPLDLRRKRL